MNGSDDFAGIDDVATSRFVGPDVAAGTTLACFSSVESGFDTGFSAPAANCVAALSPIVIVVNVSDNTAVAVFGSAANCAVGGTE